jgi:hypothetical protein
MYLRTSVVQTQEQSCDISRNGQPFRCAVLVERERGEYAGTYAYL